MPRNSRYLNPYRLVEKNENKPTDKKLQAKHTHERFSGLCGSIDIELLNLTPLVVGGRKNPRDPRPIYDKNEKDRSFAHNPEDKLPRIPGSGLKGAFWGAYELLVGSERACKHVFGDMKKKDDRDSCYLRGHIYFSDAVLDVESAPRGAESVENLHPVTATLASPKDRHKAFYQDKKAQRKLYHHQKITSIRPSESGVSTQLLPLEAGCRFTFNVRFENLEEAQLAAFLRSLFPGEGLCHKIGGAKPVGAGSVHARPLAMTICPDKSAYYRGRDNIQKFTDREQCYCEIERRCRDLEFPPDVVKMMLWREDDRRYSYPDHKWFKQNSQVELKSVDEVYPEEIGAGRAQELIDEYWRRNGELACEKRARQERERREQEQKAAFEALSPVEKAMAEWKRRGFDLKVLYNPEELDAKIPGLDHRELQRTVLCHMRDKMKDFCKEKKKKYTKAKKKGKAGSTPWEKICRKAEELGVEGFELD